MKETNVFCSVYTARKVPTAMIFVRCKDGISHHPAEYSSPEDWYAPPPQDQLLFEVTC
jgi:acetylornithine deacetylase/succinyl-diaminopimelate desuccinylase-like protein